MERLISIHGLAKRYDGFALEGIDLTLEPDRVVGLVGSNGAGKTTTLKALLGLIEPDGGTVEVLGAPLAHHTSSARIDAVKSRIGVVLDTAAFPSTARVSDVELIGRAAYRSWDRNAFWDMAARFGLDRHKKTSDLSRGMGMKLMLAFALAHDPVLLVLDEATAGLDPMAREEVLDMLCAFMARGGRGILLSSHITTDLDRIADRVVCMDAGRIVFDLEKDAICDTAGIARLSAADVERVRTSQSPGSQDLRIIRHAYDTEALVPDRAAFIAAFPDIACERAAVEDYMALTLKGELL